MEIFGILNILILSFQQYLSHHQITPHKSQDCFQNIEKEMDVINQRYRLLCVHVVAIFVNQFFYIQIKSHFRWLCGLFFWILYVTLYV